MNPETWIEIFETNKDNNALDHIIKYTQFSSEAHSAMCTKPNNRIHEVWIKKQRQRKNDRQAREIETEKNAQEFFNLNRN